MLTLTDIKDLLVKGEHLTLECKRCENKLPNSLWETYSAFANSNGGYILLGIEENRTESDLNKRFSIQGVANPDKLIIDFWNLVNDPNKVNVNLLTDNDVQAIALDDKQIIVIHVPRADYHLRPVFINNNPLHGAYRRNHEGDYHCSDAELRMMFRDINELGNDDMLLDGYSMDDIDMQTLNSYRNHFKSGTPDHPFNNLSNEEFLRQFGCLGKDKQTGNEWLTMAGLLMFGKGLPIRTRFSNLRLDYIDKSHLVGEMRYSDRLTYDGTWENNLFNF
ncbi:MAG: ATP-binding protein, partial [Paludibacteraceae bacterium]|nr:ATP-binding protein [Paludibacteraceae bacterium]